MSKLKLENNFFIKADRYYRNKLLYRFNLQEYRGFTRVARFLRNKAQSSIINLDEEGYYALKTNGNKLRFRDIETYEPIFTETKFVNRLIDDLEESEVFVDGGLFQGFFAELARSCQLENIYAFEPNFANREKFEFNTDSVDEIAIISKALWDKESKIPFRVDETHSSFDASEIKNEAETITLDSFFEGKKSPDVIKLDVEGAEMKALEGAKDILEIENPIIYLELHTGPRIKEFSHSANEVVDYLVSKGYNKELLEKKKNQVMFRFEANHSS